MVKIMNPSDSQGNQIADYRGQYPTLRGSGGAGYQSGYLYTVWDGSQIVPTLTANNAGGGQRMPDKDNFNCLLIGVDDG